jgi:hypothetical protein
MRILENRDSISFPALFAGKVSLETYFMCEEVLKQAAVEEAYTCPPQIRGTMNHEFFHRRVDEIYQAHNELFERAAKKSSFK